LPAISDATPISLDLQQADIHNVLRLFAAASDINIVTSDDVQGSVTVRLVDVPWDQALSAVLYSLGLAATVYGDRILLVHPIGAP
jgi:type IV pilus assembly protein PilQ